MRGKYLPKRQLENLDNLLSAKEKAILVSLKQCRYLLTGQVGRLHFTDNASEAAALRATHRTMQKLKDFGVVESVERRIGGVRAGSRSYVWTLTESGVYLLHLNDDSNAPRKRTFEPSLNFLKHTIEVAETYIQLTEICKRNKLELVKTEMEPECWRGYTGMDGKPATMKPDMFAITDSGKYEDYYFLEVDMNTESPNKVLDKCRRYVYYQHSGIEQKNLGIFPLVVWLVFSENRKNKLQQYIADCRDMSEQSKHIFTVIMPQELEPLICGGIDTLTEKEGEKSA